MKGNRRVIIIVTSVAAAILVALAVWYSLTYVVKADYAGKISKGNEYLEAGKYDLAVIEFQEAMEMDGEKPDAYLGLSKAYRFLGYDLLEQKTLKEGYEATGNLELQSRLAEVLPNNSDGSNSLNNGTKIKTGGTKTSDNPSGNTSNYPTTSENGHLVRGTILDAADGSSVAEARVFIYNGTAALGTPIEVQTDSDGAFTAVIDMGDHYIEVEKDGYITGSFNTFVGSNTDEDIGDFPITKELAEGVIRIVLTWGSNPTDLDSHLEGRTGTGNQIHAYYSDKQMYDNNRNLVAELDLDDVDGNGPETTTIYDMAGTYDFYVIDFTNSSTMARSGAQVQVYQGDSLVHTLDIPSNPVNRWNVLHIEQGRISVVNTAG